MNKLKYNVHTTSLNHCSIQSRFPLICKIILKKITKCLNINEMVFLKISESVTFINILKQ